MSHSREQLFRVDIDDASHDFYALKTLFSQAGTFRNLADTSEGAVMFPKRQAFLF